MHPLVKQAAKYFETAEQLNINISTHSDSIAKGVYPFSIYAWNFVGLKPRVEVKVICENEDVISEWNDIIQCAITTPVEGSVDGSSWDALEKRNIALWKNEKQKYIDDLRADVAFRLETINNNFNQTILSLEQKLRDMLDERMIRMYQSMIEDETERYQVKIQELKRKGEQADIHFTLIANGILTIK